MSPDGGSNPEHLARLTEFGKLARPFFQPGDRWWFGYAGGRHAGNVPGKTREAALNVARALGLDDVSRRPSVGNDDPASVVARPAASKAAVLKTPVKKVAVRK